MSLYRTTLVDEKYKPFVVFFRYSNKSLQDFSDEIAKQVEDSPMKKRAHGISVELLKNPVPSFLQEQAS